MIEEICECPLCSGEILVEEIGHVSASILDSLLESLNGYIKYANIKDGKYNFSFSFSKKDNVISYDKIEVIKLSADIVDFKNN